MGPRPSVVAHPSVDGPTAVLHRRPEDTAASLDGFARRRRRGLARARTSCGTGSAPACSTPCCPRSRRCGAASSWGSSVGASPAARHRPLRPAAGPADGRRALPRRRRRAAAGRQRPARRPVARGCAQRHVRVAAGHDRPAHRLPVPEGGAGELAAALVRRLQAAGGELRCGAPVRRVRVEGGRAVGRRGRRHARGRPPGRPGRRRRRGPLPRASSGPTTCRPALLARLDRFQRGWATVKVDWALRAPIAWGGDGGAVGAGTVAPRRLARRAHDGDGRAGGGAAPDRAVPGARADDDDRPHPLPRRAPSRRGPTPTCPPGCGTSPAWATPAGRWPPPTWPRWSGGWRPAIERFAPGFRDLILARHVLGPERHGGGRRQPRGRRHRRRHLPAAPAAGVPADPGAGPVRDAGAAGCTCPRRRRTRAAASTAPAAPTPPGPPCCTTASPGSRRPVAQGPGAAAPCDGPDRPSAAARRGGRGGRPRCRRGRRGRGRCPSPARWSRSSSCVERIGRRRAAGRTPPTPAAGR